MDSLGSYDVISLIASVGAPEVGRRFVAQAWEKDPTQEWILHAVAFGRGADRSPLPDEVWWNLAMAALDATPDDDVALWLRGDMVFDHLRERPGMSSRPQAKRAGSVKVSRLFEAMQRELRNEGVTSGYWFEDHA